MRLYEIYKTLKPRDVLASGVRADEIPMRFREKYPMIGRGTTSLVYDYDKDNVLVFTRDVMKEEWTRVALQLSNFLEEFEVRHVSHIKGMGELPIMVYTMTKLYPLSPANKKLVKAEIERYHDLLWSIKANDRYGLYHQDLWNYYMEHYPNSVLMPVFDWMANYDSSQFEFDFHMKNFMQTSEGEIVPVDPVISTELYKLVMDHLKNKDRSTYAY
jgi:hypothetical protein